MLEWVDISNNLRMLLIEPLGIEIREYRYGEWSVISLLIEPLGIEIMLLRSRTAL